MKRLTAFLLCLVAIGCKTKVVTPKVSLVPVQEVKADAKARAYEAGTRILGSCNTSRFKPFNALEATPKLIGQITPDKITKICLKFRLKYGQFKDLRLQQVWKGNNDALLFRYKADYERKHTQRELRITLAGDGRITAIKSADWHDNWKPEPGL